MSVWDVFNQDAFGVISLTAAVNKQPYTPGQVGRLGVFDEQGVDTIDVAIEQQDGKLALVAPSQRGGPGETVGREDRSIRVFRVPHFQRDDALYADEIQGVRAFGEETEAEMFMQRINNKMARHVRALDATEEHQRVGALKGLVTDKNGNAMFNLYSEFGITPAAAVNFALTTDSTKVREKCFDVINGIEDDLDDDSFDHVHCLAGRDFWKGLIEHKSVKETYLNTVQAAELRGDPNVFKFEFGGIVWERYRTGKAATADVGAPFIGANEARFFPVGVPDFAITRFAPADYIETVNTLGLPRYEKMIRMTNDKGMAIEVQKNAISLVTRPEALRQGTAS